MGEQRQYAVCLIRSRLQRCGQGFDVACTHGSQPQFAEFRQDDGLKHSLVVAETSRPFVRDGVALKVLCGQVRNGRLSRLLLLHFQRIVTVLNARLQFCSLTPGGFNRPFGMSANGVAPLSAMHAIVENVAFDPAGGEPNPKPFDLGIPYDSVPLPWGSQLFHAPLTNFRWHGLPFSILCQHHVNKKSAWVAFNVSESQLTVCVCQWKLKVS